MRNRLVQNAKIVDKFLIQYLRRQDKSLLISPMKYGVISGGKKIRSTIIFDTGKIFNIKKKNLEILIHPSSYVHAIVLYQGNLIKFLAHEPKMSIPIANALGLKNRQIKFLNEKKIINLNKLTFEMPDTKKFPVLSIIDSIPERTSYFETILITINDTLVNKYLNNQINYISIQKNLLNIIKNPYFKKYYKLKPKNIYDIKKMIIHTKNYLNKNIIYYDK